MTEYLAVTRTLVSADHSRLRSHISSINHDLPPHVSLKWLRLGETGAHLVTTGEFDAMSRRPGNRFRSANIDDAKKIIEAGLKLRNIAQETDTANVIGADFFGLGRYVSIGYLLDPGPRKIERSEATKLIDELSGSPFNWRYTRPHVPVATVDSRDADSEILDVFLKPSIKPASLKLQPAEVIIDR